VTPVANLPPSLACDLLNIRSRFSRDRRLKFRVRSSPVPAAVDARSLRLAAKRDSETRVAAYGISGSATIDAAATIAYHRIFSR
jgi:hypothetical protein